VTRSEVLYLICQSCYAFDAVSRTGNVSSVFFRHVQKYFTTEGLDLPPIARMQTDRNNPGSQIMT